MVIEMRLVGYSSHVKNFTKKFGQRAIGQVNSEDAKMKMKELRLVRKIGEGVLSMHM